MRQSTARSRKTIPRVRKRRKAFFRLSPAAADKLSCFAVRRGEVRDRIDPKFILHGGHQNIASLKIFPLGSLTVREPDYGSNIRAVPMSKPDEVKYIRITDFDDDGIPLNHEFVTAEVIEDNCRLIHEDVLFARSGATAGKTFIYTEDIGPAVFAGYCIRFRFNQKRVLPKFVYYYTKTTRYKAWVRSIQRPSGQPNINKEEFKSFTIPVPDVNVQANLVTDLESAHTAKMNKLAKAEDLLAGLDAFILRQLGLRAPDKDNCKVFAIRLGDILQEERCDASYHRPVFRKVVQSLAACPYAKTSLGKISPDPAGGATPTKGDAELYTDSGIKFLRILNVKPNEFDFGELKFIKREVHEGELRRSQLAVGDVLMTITGRVGNAAVVTEDILPANINQHIVRLRVTQGDILPEYLAAFLNCSVGLALSNRGVTGGTRIALDYEAVGAIPIPIPPLSLQETIAAEVGCRRMEARQLRSEADTDWTAAKARFEQQLLRGL
jgi:restriction endonuclease S subunit